MSDFKWWELLLIRILAVLGLLAMVAFLLGMIFGSCWVLYQVWSLAL
jgi:hypothetical protein